MGKNTKFGTCIFCDQQKKILKSHSIPLSLMLDVMNNGSVTRIHQNWETKKTGESGWSHMLCDTCEKDFNENFDKYAIEAVRARETAPFDHTKIALFITSVIWRSHHSTANMYKGFSLTPNDVANMKGILKGITNPFKEYTFEMSNLFDSKLRLQSGHLKLTLGPPNYAKVEIGQKVHSIYHFNIHGYFFAAITPKISAPIEDWRYLTEGKISSITDMRDIHKIGSIRRLEDKIYTESDKLLGILLNTISGKSE